MTHLTHALQGKAFLSQILPMVQPVTPDELTLLHFIFIAISILGISVGCYLIAYKQGHNAYMGIFTLAMASILLELTLLWWDGEMHLPKIPFHSSLIFLLGPSLYLYLDQKVHSYNKVRTKKVLLFYGPFLLSFLLLFLLTNSDTLTAPSGIRGYGMRLLNSGVVKSLFSTVFLAMMIRRYTQYKKVLEKVEGNWIRMLIGFFIALTLLHIVGSLFKHEFMYKNIVKYTRAYFFSVFIISVSFLLYLVPDLVTAPLYKRVDRVKLKGKYQNSGLTPTMSKTLREHLLASMENKVYLDQNLTLAGLAKILDTDRYSLSQVINQEFNKNFYEFINDYRIMECMSHISNSPTPPESITDLVYESGFNNKVSFYKAFKMRNGVTPSEYIRALHGE